MDAQGLRGLELCRTARFTREGWVHEILKHPEM